MGSSKKHKKHKSERRDKYEEYSNNMDPSNLQRGLKLILKVGANSTPEYSEDSPLTYTSGPPTAAEAMMSAAPSSPVGEDDDLRSVDFRVGEKHKKSKKKKKKRDREKKHKHHKDKRHKRERLDSSQQPGDDLGLDTSSVEHIPDSDDPHTKNVAATVTETIILDGDSSQDALSFIDDDISQPLPEHVLLYAGITTENSPSCRPVTKPIVPLKTEEINLVASPSNSSIATNPMSMGSPLKPLTDILIPSPTASNAGSTPGGHASFSNLTPKHSIDAPKTPSSSSESGREPRTCVLKLKQQKSPLNKLLDHLLRFLEKRDPHQFFAWPVTDDIAPGYSSIITRPMDFSTIRQKIDDSEYTSLTEFTDDFKLMCENAILYNHVDTVYHKAAKRLFQVGIKHLSPDNLMRSLKPLSCYMRELSAKELGFELTTDFDTHTNIDSADEGASTGAEELLTSAQQEEEDKRRALRLKNEPKSRYEPYVDDLSSEEILLQVQEAAKLAKERLNGKQNVQKLGFLRQRKDGTTTLNLLLKDSNEGPEKVVTIGDLVGKLKTGTGQLQMPREDKRNVAKCVKPLAYGAFTSFAPTYDSRFATMNKEETQLIMQTYGDATSAEYAESILEFTKDSDYASMMANGLLDILTGGEHSKMMQGLKDLQEQYHEQTEVHKCFPLEEADIQMQDGRAQIEEEFEKYKNIRVDFNRLRSLQDLGIDVNFLDTMEKEMKHFELTRRLQEHLHSNMNLIEKLRVTQHNRLSQPLPQHLALLPHPSAEETQLAHQITQKLADLAKKLPPAAIAEPHAIRKAMGVSYVGLPPLTATKARITLPEVLQAPVSLTCLPSLRNNTTIDLEESSLIATTGSHVRAASLPMEIDDDVVCSTGVDLESELREFLECGGDSALHGTQSSDDTNFVQMLINN